MLKTDKQKDTKNKQKLDLTKSTQNLTYMVSPLDQQAQACLASVSKVNQLDKVQTIYEIEMDTQAKRPFLKTPYNCYKDKVTNKCNYRSPYSNKYYPQNLNEALFPSPLVRNIEQKGQILFEEYAKMYYGDCINNFFVEESEDQFCFAFYVQKKYEDNFSAGIWNSTNVANISGDPTKSITYKITTSVIYEITCKEDSDSNKPFTISGNIKRTKNQSKKLTPDIQLDELHLTVIGRSIQQNQTFIRQQIETVFARKTKQIIFKTRIPQGKASVEEQRKLMKQLMESNLVKKQSGVQF